VPILLQQNRVGIASPGLFGDIRKTFSNPSYLRKMFAPFREQAQGKVRSNWEFARW
jgi:hypothetical protein